MATIDDDIEEMVIGFAAGVGVDPVALGDAVDRIIQRECVARIGRYGLADQIQPADAEAMLHAAWLEATRRHRADVCPRSVYALVEAMLDRVAEATPRLH